MTTSLPKSAIAKFTRGALLVAAALSLAACETTGAGTAAPAAAAAPAAPINPMADEKPSKPQGPMTHREAALECWMSTEHGHADMPLDKRADVVDKCIAQKMQGK